jgi:hypothetical protein
MSTASSVKQARNMVGQSRSKEGPMKLALSPSVTPFVTPGKVSTVIRRYGKRKASIVDSRVR